MFELLRRGLTPAAVLSVVLMSAALAQTPVPTTTTIEVYPENPAVGDTIAVFAEVTTPDLHVPDGVYRIFRGASQIGGSASMRGPATFLAAGSGSSCAVTAARGVECWGSAARGQLGAAGAAGGTTPVAVSTFTSGVRAIAAGDQFHCLLTTAGAVHCFGRNDVGQLGDGSRTDRTTPVQVAGLASGVTMIAARGTIACALRGTTEVLCWGDGDTTPVARSAFARPVKALTVGYRICAIDADLQAWCAEPGSVGGVRGAFAKVAGLPRGTTAIAAGRSHVCTIQDGQLSKSSIWCWGSNADGQFGNGTTSTTIAASPVRIGQDLYGGGDAIAAGDTSTCRLRFVELDCTGTFGTSPTGIVNAVTFTSVPLGTPYPVTVSIGADHVCATREGGGVKCWGDGTGGKLGALDDLVVAQRLGETLHLDDTPPGTYTFTAEFVNFLGETTYQETSASTTILVKAQSTIALASSKASATYGDAVTVTAAITASDGNVPTGSLQFLRNGVPVADAPIDVTGKAELVETGRDAGSYTYTATYAGSTVWTSAASPALVQTWAPASATLAVTSGNPAAAAGQAVTFTVRATSTTGTPTGRVRFEIDGTPTAPKNLVDGVATHTVSDLAAGVHTVAATLLAGGNYTAAPASITQSVTGGSRTTLATSVRSVRVGGLIPFAITVTDLAGKPLTGSVDIIDAGRIVGSADLDAAGKAAVSHRTIYTGRRSYTASYHGNTVARPSTSPAVAVDVAKGQMVIAAPGIPAQQRFGRPLSIRTTFVENVDFWSYTGVPFTLDVDGKPLGDPVESIDGTIVFDLPKGLPFGTHAVTVRFAGSDDLDPAASRTVTSAADFRVGTETPVGQPKAGFEREPAVAAGQNGALVVWQHQASAAAPGRILARRLDAGGQPVGSDIRVDVPPAGSAQSNLDPDVTVLSTGDYAVVWRRMRPGSNLLSDLYLRILGADGSFKTGEIRANLSGTPAERASPVVQAAGAGFWVAWYQAPVPTNPGGSYAAYMTRFDNLGTKIVTDFNPVSGGGVRRVGMPGPKLFPVGVPGQVVFGYSPSGLPLMQLIGPSGAKVGAPVKATLTTSASNAAIAFLPLPANKFAVVWSSTLDGSSLRWRRFTNALVADGGETVIAKGTVGQNRPSTAVVSGNRPVVAWTRSDGGGDGGVALLDTALAVIGGLGTTNLTTAGSQADPVVAGLKTNGASGRSWIAVWASDTGSKSSITLQRFEAP